MLDHFRCIDQIKFVLVPVPLRCQLLGGAASIVNHKLAHGKMRLCSLDGLSGGVNGGDVGTQPRHWLRQNAAATPDIKNAQASQRCLPHGHFIWGIFLVPAAHAL